MKYAILLSYFLFHSLCAMDLQISSDSPIEQKEEFNRKVSKLVLQDTRFPGNTISASTFLSYVPSCVTYLQLSSCNLGKIESSALSNFSALKTIDLSYNNLNEVPNLNSCPFLKYINLRNNQLKVITENSFSNHFVLEDIDLSNNRINSIHSQAFEHCKRLQELRLTSNPVKIKLPLIKGLFRSLSGARQFSLNIFLNTENVPLDTLQYVHNTNKNHAAQAYRINITFVDKAAVFISTGS